MARVELINFLVNGHVQWPRWLTLVVAGHDVSPTVLLFSLGVILVSIGPLLFVLAAPCILLLALAMALALIPYGPRFALAGMSLLLSAEATPPGQWVLTQLPPGAAPLQDSGAFSHGTHSDTEAMTILRRWLSENLRGRPSHCPIAACSTAAAIDEEVVRGMDTRDTCVQGCYRSRKRIVRKILTPFRLGGVGVLDLWSTRRHDRSWLFIGTSAG